MDIAKQVIITGASSDLGRALVAELGKDESVKIIGTMMRKRSANEVYSKNITMVDHCDLTTVKCCETLAGIADDHFTGPFGVVHSVGQFWNHVPFSEYSPQAARDMLDSHVTTFYNVMFALIPIMRARGGGSTVAFSCSSVKYNYPWMASFTAAKSAVDSLVRSLANEFSGDGLRFNSLVLSSLKTTKVRESKPYGDFEHFTPPDDIAPIVRFLLSDEAYLVNGNTISLLSHSDDFYRTGYFKRVAK
jgi:NAD(P)-dependent dehydrogenase (short-subunit alcohol dehydrogenase family)